MDVAVSNRVVARNGLGQFIAACEAAATATVEQAIKDGEALSRAMAPTGKKKDPRTVTLKEGMFSAMLSATSGHWGCRARHALPVEFGSVRHFQTGWVDFFWENQGRMWTAGENMIDHPADAAQPYLRPAYTAIMNRVMAIAAANYPG